jgi:hypothetical protein
MGEKKDRNKPPTPASSSRTLPRRDATRCRHKWPLELLHHGTFALKLRIQDRRSLRSREASTHTPISIPWKPLILTTLRGGLTTSTASHTSTKDSDILDRNESTSSAPRHQDHHYTSHDNSNLGAPWILYTLAATQTKRTRQPQVPIK